MSAAFFRTPAGTHFQQVLGLRHLLTPTGLGAVCRLLAGEHLGRRGASEPLNCTTAPQCDGASVRPRATVPTRATPSYIGSKQGTTTTARTFHKPASRPHLRVVSSTLGADGGVLPLLLPLSPPPGASARQLSVCARCAGRAALRQRQAAGRQVRGAEAAGHLHTRGRACIVAMCDQAPRVDGAMANLAWCQRGGRAATRFASADARMVKE